MKKINITFTFLLVLFIVCIGSMACDGCSSIVTTYKDTNGPDDYSLQVLKDEDILNKNSHYLEKISVSSTNDGVNKYTVNELHGVKQLVRVSRKSGTITVSFKVNSGNAKLCLTNGVEILEVFEINKDNQIFKFENPNDTYFLKVVGECANLEVSYVISYN